jgi:RNA polymerase sigma-70 factor (ECF subfamily)
MSNRETAPGVQRFDDVELVDAAAGGDRLAFEELVRRHQQEVFTLAVRLLGSRELAADVTQDALIRAWRGLPSFRGEAAFSTWLHRITVNAAWSARRKARRHAAANLEQVEHELPGVDHVAIEGEAIRLRGELKSAVASLTPGTRAVVILKDVYGWSHADIAGALGISVTAAKVRLHRGRSQLQTLLEDVR